MKISPYVLCILCFLPLGALSADRSGSEDQSLDALRAFIEVYEHIKEEYVEEIDDQTLLDYAINGMLSKLDPHSAYMGPKDVSSLQESTSGAFAGIGIEIDLVDGLIQVVAPIDNSPASRAGILAKDVITHINGVPFRDINLKKAIETLRGQIGAEVELQLLRETNGTAKELTILLERAIIRVTSVQHEMLPHGIGYLRISQFQKRTASDLIKAISNLKYENNLKGLILDLRNNPGGMLSAAIEVTDSFIKKGLIVSTKGRGQFLNERYEATETTVVDDEPIVVIINGGSASAAEIVAGALQDHKRAVVVGTPSFGKGSVQTILALKNDHALKLTTALYLTPSGRSIQATGIQPTIEVSEGKPLAGFRTGIREADLTKHIQNSNESELTDEKKSSRLTEDNQFFHAYNLLRGSQLLLR